MCYNILELSRTSLRLSCPLTTLSSQNSLSRTSLRLSVSCLLTTLCSQNSPPKCWKPSAAAILGPLPVLLLLVHWVYVDTELPFRLVTVRHFFPLPSSEVLACFSNSSPWFCRKVEDTAVRLRLDLVCGKVLLEKVLHGSKLLEEILKVLEEVLEVGGAGPEAGVGVEGVVAHGLVLSAPLRVTQHLVGFRYLPRHNWMRIAKTTLYFTILQLKRYYPVLIYQ